MGSTPNYMAHLYTRNDCHYARSIAENSLMPSVDCRNLCCSAGYTAIILIIVATTQYPCLESLYIYTICGIDMITYIFRFLTVISSVNVKIHFNYLRKDAFVKFQLHFDSSFMAYIYLVAVILFPYSKHSVSDALK